MIDTISLDMLEGMKIQFPDREWKKGVNAKISIEWLMDDAKLSPKLRETIELVAKGYKDTQIGKMLHCRRATITERKRAAIRKMRKVLH